jgi:hypothetical protein
MNGADRPAIPLGDLACGQLTDEPILLRRSRAGRRPMVVPGRRPAYTSHWLVDPSGS